MRIIAQIAVGLAYNARPEHRWRRVAVPLTAAVALLLLFATTSALVLLQREEARDERRSALLATEPAPTDLLLEHSSDKWQGEQFPVYWIEPAGEEPPVLPMGMPHLPEPGQAVVSPALDRLCERYPSLAARYPNRLVLGEEGLRSGGELIAFIRVQEGRTLANKEFPPRRIRGFGPPAPGDAAVGFVRSLSFSPQHLAAGIIIILIFPALLVLALGVAAGSTVRDHRFALLHWLGAPARTLVALAALETTLLAVPGLGAAILLWAVVAPALTQVPLVGYEVLRGDLGLPVGMLLMEAVGLLLVIGLIAATMALIQGRRASVHSRPRTRQGRTHPLRVVPLVLSTALLVMSTALGGEGSGNRELSVKLLLVGLVLAVPSVPLLLPSLLRPFGRVLVRLDAVPALLAGRMLRWDSVRVARPFAAIAALVILASVTTTYEAFQRYERPAPPTTGPQSVRVLWRDRRPEDPANLQKALESGLVMVGMYEKTMDGSRVALGTTCPELTEYFPGASCDTADPYALPPAIAQSLVRELLVPSVRLIPPDELSFAEDSLVDIVVIDNTSSEELGERVRTVAMPLLPVASVRRLEGRMSKESKIAWLQGGLMIGLLALAVGCVVAIVDRYLGTQQHRQHLLRLGLSPRRLMILELWQFATPYTLTVVVASVAALALCGYMVYSNNFPMPWTTLGVILALAVLIGLLGTASVALFGDRTGVVHTRE